MLLRRGGVVVGVVSPGGGSGGGCVIVDVVSGCTAWFESVHGRSCIPQSAISCDRPVAIVVSPHVVDGCGLAVLVVFIVVVVVLVVVLVVVVVVVLAVCPHGPDTLGLWFAWSPFPTRSLEHEVVVVSCE